MALIISEAAAPVALAVVAVGFGRPRFGAVPAGAERFRFDNRVRWLLLGFVVLCWYIGYKIVSDPQLPQGSNAIYVYIALADVIPAILLYAFIYYWALYVDVSDAGIVVSTLYGDRRVPYSQITRADISTGSFGRRPLNVVMLYDTRGLKVVRVTGNFVDFPRFVSLIKDRLRHTGALVRMRSS